MNNNFGIQQASTPDADQDLRHPAARRVLKDLEPAIVPEMAITPGAPTDQRAVFYADVCIDESRN